jgi:hypothetical protein
MTLKRRATDANGDALSGCRLGPSRTAKLFVAEGERQDPSATS